MKICTDILKTYREYQESWRGLAYVIDKKVAKVRISAKVGRVHINQEDLKSCLDIRFAVNLHRLLVIYIQLSKLAVKALDP